MARPAARIELTTDEQNELSRRVQSHTVAARDRLRARIILARASGLGQGQIAAHLAVSVPTVNKWCQRFVARRLAGLTDGARSGRPASLSAATLQHLVERVTQPPPGRTRWSLRSMAEAAAVAPSTVHRVWRANGLQPHLTRTFKLSRDPRFEQKFWDVIGLYLAPPERALVLCCDEKSQCQALERSQPGLPLGVGHVRTQTHDYTRHGTITLFAALNYLDGKLIGRTEAHHTHVEWLRFLRQLDRETPRDLDLHLILDNYCTHKQVKVTTWLERHLRFHLHFTPTGSSWLNLIERFFRDLTVDVVREGSFAHVRELIDAIDQYLAARNLAPKPYRWRASGEAILAKIQRARQALARQTELTHN